MFNANTYAKVLIAKRYVANCCCYGELVDLAHKVGFRIFNGAMSDKTVYHFINYTEQIYECNIFAAKNWAGIDFAITDRKVIHPVIVNKEIEDYCSRFNNASEVMSSLSSFQYELDMNDPLADIYEVKRDIVSWLHEIEMFRALVKEKYGRNE